MNGLDALIQRILEDADARVAEYRDATRAAVAAIEAETDEAARAIRQESERSLEAETRALERRSESQAALERRKEWLAARQAEIARILDAAVEALCLLPESLRTDLYASLLEPEAARGGAVRFSARDLEAGVAARSVAEGNRRSAAAGGRGDAFSLDPVPGAFRGGLLLRQGDVEDNRTFDLIVRQFRGDLESLAAAHLFPDA